VADTGSIYGALSVLRGGAPSVWETCEVLLNQLDSTRVVIAATQFGSYLDRMARNALPAERLFIYPTRSSLGSGPFSRALSPCRREIPNIVLGQYDRDINPARRPWPNDDSDAVVRMRTVDELHGQSHKLGLIVIEADMLDILTGAIATIQHHQPAILLNLLALPPTERLIEWDRCATLLATCAGNYHWYDGFLLSCDTPERRLELVTSLSGGVACAFPEATAEATAPGALRITGGLAMLAERDWVPDIRFDPNRKGKVRIVFDSGVRATGLYPPETNGAGLWWSWSGPTSRIRVALPLPGGGRWFVRLHIFDWGVARSDRDLRAFVDEKELILVDSDLHFVRFGPILVSPREASGRLMIEINTPRTRRASDNDSRLIGVCISGCGLERDS
jgi:hypothetical protein